MKENLSGKLLRNVPGLSLAIILGGVMAAPVSYANPSNNIVLVPPSDLPTLARQPGEAMLLRETIDGRAILYVEQEQGARLAIFDVTDPVHISGEGSVQLSIGGPFDFVSPIDSRQELIEYRQGRKDAVLDFHKVKFPKLKAVDGFSLQGPITRLGNDGFIVDSQDPRVPSAQDWQVVDTTSSPILSTVFDVKELRDAIAKADTGTTFLLAKEGLYVVRRPAVESEKRRRDEEWFWQHTGN
jgi:hypothetical protein